MLVLTSACHATYALCDTSLMTYISCYMFRHWGPLLREPLQQRYIQQHANLSSASLYKNDWSLKKMLRYVKLKTINYCIMILNIKMCNVTPTQLPFLICFYFVDDVCRRRSRFLLIWKDLVQIRRSKCTLHLIWGPHRFIPYVTHDKEKLYLKNS